MEMNGCSEKDEDCPQLLDLIPKHRQWLSAVDVTGKTQTSDDKKLELTLGLPGDADWSRKERNDSLLSFGHFPTSSKFSPSENPWPSSANFLGKLQPNKFSGFCSKMEDLQNAEAKSFPSSANTPVSNTSQKRYTLSFSWVFGIIFMAVETRSMCKKDKGSSYDRLVFLWSMSCPCIFFNPFHLVIEKWV